MLNRSAIFRTAWRRARLEAGTRYGITVTLRQAFAAALRKVYAEMRAQKECTARMVAELAKAAAEMRAAVRTPAGALRAMKSGERWRFANCHPYGGM